MEGLVLSENRIFLVSDDRGDVLPDDNRGFGLYHLDTRFLSHLALEVNNFRPSLLTSSSEHNYLENIQLTNPAFTQTHGETTLEIPPQTISVRRNRLISGALEERIGLFNYNRFPVNLEISLTFAADFRDMFDVRGYRRAERGRVLAPTVGGEPFAATISEVITLNYEGLDGTRRQTILSFEKPSGVTIEYQFIVGGQFTYEKGLLLPQMTPAPPEFELEPPGVRVRFHLRLEAQTPLSLTYYALPVVEESATSPSPSPSNHSVQRPRARFDLAAVGIQRSYQEDWFDECALIETDNTVLNQMLYRGQVDIRALLAHFDEGKFPFAGIPWYSAPFGRDAIITSAQVLMLNPEVAVGALRFLAATQGNELNDWRDEEPGKILHEIRYGEFARRGLVPHLSYYGTADATPLFLVLFCLVMDWLGDEALFAELLPNVERALEWIDRYGDRDGDGLIEYASRSTEGLRNQGWKDSGDAYQYEEGGLAEPPIAPVEVQGYVYDAKMRLAGLFRQRGQPARAREFEESARRLRVRIDEQFWMEAQRFYALGLGPDKRQIDLVTSNPGHLLWSGAVEDERARLVARRLLSGDMFSGWGVRTLSSQSKVFNPMGYHLGTVWPHDNSLVAAGLKRYGFDAEANQVIESVFQAGHHFRYFRLPELYCGFNRDYKIRATPAEYPVSCSPQSWAAGSIFLFMQTMLGLEADAARHRVYLRPSLPSWLRYVRVRKLRVGNAQVDFVVDRQGVRERQVTGDPELRVVRRR